MALNIKIKARSKDPASIKEMLASHQADFKGVDHQLDTYFNVPNGRIKFREGNIENYLIHYDRPNRAGPKKSIYILYHPHPDSSLKQLLTQANGILIVVDKLRSIYLIDNVKSHVDEVKIWIILWRLKRLILIVRLARKTLGAMSILFKFA
jgi:adenylate cyclase class 2